MDVHEKPDRAQCDLQAELLSGRKLYFVNPALNLKEQKGHVRHETEQLTRPVDSPIGEQRLDIREFNCGGFARDPGIAAVTGNSSENESAAT